MAPPELLGVLRDLARPTSHSGPAVSRWGWPVRTLPGGRLHPLVDPEAVAATLGELPAQLAPAARDRSG